MGGGPLGAIIGRYPSGASGGSGGADGERTMGGGIIWHNRKCRDVVFLVLFITFWVAMIVNSSFGFNQGNPLRLTYGLDYKGNVCGDKHANPDLRELEIRYWMNPNQVYESGLKGSQFTLVDTRSICLMECPIPSEDGLNWVCDYPDGDIHISVDDWIDRDYDYYEFLTPAMRNSSLQLQGPCYPVIFPSVNVYWSCQFIALASNASMRHWQQMGGVNINENILIDKTIHRAINSQSSVLKRYVADIGKAWPVLIVCGGMVPLFLSLIWLLMIRHFVSGMTWITVILFNVLIISVTMFYYAKAGWIGNDVVSVVIGDSEPYFSFSGREISHLRAMAVLMTIVMIISILSSIAIVRRILMATSVLKVAAKVIGEVQALIVFPVFPYAILAIFYMFWFSAAMHLFSSGHITKNDCNANCCSFDLKSNQVSCAGCCGYRIHYTSHIAAAILFHLFGFFWATQFIIACSATVIAGSVASYYWAHGEVSQEVPFLPVFASMKRLMRYNLGSVALGSLVVSIVESIRFILESLRRRLKLVNTVPVSRIEKMTLFSSNCFLGCIDWILRSVNRSAYIMIAITGKGFCKASSIATGLIMNNILRIGKVNVIGDIILFLGKLCVSLFCALFAFLMLDTYKYKSAHNRISSPLFPVLVCWGLGYIVATLFFSVVEMSIDTVILSFCQDADEHQGSAQYAPPLLMETLDGQAEMQRLTQGT
ncbi:choline transporter-like protein 2 [Phalaenopsis equestris]|uniref:choline transporter-like protein 2 n=1 Tax=Phalaenopsis equestris TaxID=78828 RepID=UPI0009E583A3|nr:choline transporter-like protein 2 [Phalaenopsis equestris]